MDEDEYADPKSLTIKELKQQLTKWNVILPPTAQQKSVYPYFFRF